MIPGVPGGPLAVFWEVVEADYRVVAVTLGILGILVVLHLVRRPPRRKR